MIEREGSISRESTERLADGMDGWTRGAPSPGFDGIAQPVAFPQPEPILLAPAQRTTASAPPPVAPSAGAGIAFNAPKVPGTPDGAAVPVPATVRPGQAPALALATAPGSQPAGSVRMLDGQPVLIEDRGLTVGWAWLFVAAAVLFMLIPGERDD